MELVPASGGAFEITVNREKIYSKLETRRYPAVEDVIARMTK
ncbi:hypothetical protein B0X71_10355 [Planococcus lenghuensis]|uniref:SelT/SelW/SelH family protein n=1 Tax=Planococcus lenghuensis TaxID=2213202 RepID=A0A1Q2L3T3_9BACL|nr:hypothetical protein B0X71_10355 [Planococcus lenghuensis]